MIVDQKLGEGLFRPNLLPIIVCPPEESTLLAALAGLILHRPYFPS